MSELASESPAQLWLATGSCGTQAGCGRARSGSALGAEVVGVTVSKECVARIAALAREVAQRIGVAPPEGAPSVLDGHIGPGYGYRSPAGDAAARLVARTEGVFLDPIFAAKAMAGLLAAAGRGEVAGPVVFLVTGGAPTLFTAT